LGSTTWLNAIAPNYSTFLVTRSSTGIDDSSYPGLFSLVSDYFGPKMRGKVYGLLQFTQPLGYLVGMVLGLLLSDLIGWRGVFYITGSLGIVMAVVIFFGVKEVPRGQSEPEMSEIDLKSHYRFDWKIAADLLKKPSLLLLFVQGFLGFFWNAIIIWFFLPGTERTRTPINRHGDRSPRRRHWLSDRRILEIISLSDNRGRLFVSMIIHLKRSFLVHLKCTQ
jgi:MFS family permease